MRKDCCPKCDSKRISQIVGPDGRTIKMKCKRCGFINDKTI